MRKHPVFNDGMASPPQYSTVSISAMLASPAPSPSLPLPDSNVWESFYFPSIPVADSAFDLVTISLIASLVLLSILSFAFIILLRLRSRNSYHLQNFNSLWTVRLLLVSLVCLWAVNEITRLPFVRRKYIYPFLPFLTLNQQADLCKFHIVLSLGFFEPGFFVTLLFLVNVSIKKRNPCRGLAYLCVCAVCAPVALLQTFFVSFSPLQAQLPKFMHGSSVLTSDMYGHKTVLCTYPFFSSLVFAAFALAYSLAFLLSCWRVLDYVINKSIRKRVNVLVITVMVVLPFQILCLAISPLFYPDETGYGVVILAMLAPVTFCMAVGEVILVIKPIIDALAVGGDRCQWNPTGISLQEQVVDRELKEDQDSGL